MYDRSADNPEASYYLVRHRFMSEYGLSFDDMDDAEINRRDEVLYHMKIFELKSARQEKEEMRAEQSARSEQQ